MAAMCDSVMHFKNVFMKNLTSICDIPRTYDYKHYSLHKNVTTDEMTKVRKIYAGFDIFRLIKLSQLFFKVVLYSKPGTYLVDLTVTLRNIVGKCFAAVCSGLNPRRYFKSNYTNVLTVLTAAGKKSKIVLYHLPILVSV